MSADEYLVTACRTYERAAPEDRERAFSDLVRDCPDDLDPGHLVAHLVSIEFEAAEWCAEMIRARLDALPEVPAGSEARALALRISRTARQAHGDSIPWDALAGFGYRPDQLGLGEECDPFALGQVLVGRYELRRRLGNGSFGTVYAAQDRRLGAAVAVKTPRYGPRDDKRRQVSCDRLRKEAVALGKVSHDRIPRLLGLHKTPEGTPFIVMEHVEGRSLKAILCEAGTLSPERSVAVVMDVAEALQTIYDAEMTHRDVKPSNIIADAAGRCVLIDFGLALPEAEQFNRDGEIAGSDVYMSPEAITGQVSRLDQRSDVWSLGVLLYELLTGRVPSLQRSREAAFVAAALGGHQGFAFPPEVPADLATICTRCMSWEPDRRFETPKRLMTALHDLVGATT